MRQLSTHDLRTNAKYLKDFRGVFPSDYLPKRGPRKRECGIINLETHIGEGRIGFLTMQAIQNMYYILIHLHFH